MDTLSTQASTTSLNIPCCGIAIRGTISALALIIAAVAIAALFVPPLAPVVAFFGAPLLISAAVIGGVAFLVALIGAIQIAKLGNNAGSNARRRPLVSASDFTPSQNKSNTDPASRARSEDNIVAIEHQSILLPLSSKSSQRDESFKAYWDAKASLVQAYCERCNSPSITEHLNLIVTHPLIENFKDETIALLDLMNLDKDPNTIQHGTKIRLDLPVLLKDMNKFLLEQYIKGKEDNHIQTKQPMIPAKTLVLLYAGLTYFKHITATAIQKVINGIDLEKGFDPVDAGKIFDAFQDLRTSQNQ